MVIVYLSEIARSEGGGMTSLAIFMAP
jgi:hypothetical protein